MSVKQLGTLIKALSKNEKTYFKRWLPTTAKENRYIAVFDVIEKQPDIPPGELVKHLNSGYNSKKLGNIKSHLWSSLLLALRDYHRKNDFQLSIHSRLDSIRILRLKGQLEAAFSESNKLLKECQEIEMLPEALRAIEHIENILNVQNPVETGSFDWSKLYKTKETICNALAESCKIRAIERELKSLNDRLEKTLTQDEYENCLKELLADLEKVKLSNDSSFDARFRFFSIQATVASVLKNYADIEKWFKEMIDLLDGYPTIVEKYFKGFYIIALHNYISSLLCAKKVRPVPALLAKMNESQAEVPALQTRDFYIYWSSALKYHTIVEDYKLGLQEWKSLPKARLSLDDTFLERHFADFMMQGAVICFWNNEYRLALNILRSLFKNLSELGIKTFYEMPKTLEIVCNYELSDFDHTEHLLQVFFRRNSSLEVKPQLETLILKTISQDIQQKPSSIYTWQNFEINLKSMSSESPYDCKTATFDLINYAKIKSTQV